MTDFIEGECRSQSTLFPERLDDYIEEESSVRVIDVFVDELDLGAMGFKIIPAATGRPAYNPATMLKIYIYGYLNRIQTSRRLEREAQRNLELMWLTGRLMPDFKTIADFRKDNGPAIQKVCREFVLICRKLSLFTDAFVAIDGSKFKAVNTRDKNFTRAKITRRLNQIDESIARYLATIESEDRRALKNNAKNTARLQDKVSKLKSEIKRLQDIDVSLSKTDDQQISLTDPDSRSMATSGRGSGVVGYNVQSAVDVKNNIIVAHEVTNVGHDRSALFNTAQLARKAIGEKRMKVVADRGYYSGTEILKCEQSNLTTFIPKTHTSNNQAKGLYGKRDFIWVAKDKEYQCPAGERLIKRTTMKEGKKLMDRYWSNACSSCTLKPKCTTGKERRVSRWKYEYLLDRVQKRMARTPDIMRIRRETVEHPFGTIKCWMGYTHFQTRTLKRVSTEMSLHVLAYNLKRVMQIMGTRALMVALQT